MFNLGMALEIQPIRTQLPRLSTRMELLYVMSGEASVELLDGERRLSAEDVLVINRGQSYSVRAVYPGTMSCFSAEPALIKECRNTYIPIDCCSRGAPDGSRYKFDELRRLLRRLMLEYLRGDSETTFGFVQQGCALIDYLCNTFPQEETPLTLSADRADGRIEQIVGYIHENYHTQITLSDLAAAFFVSDSHLSRILKTSLGIGFREYLCKVRLQHAMEDLVKTDKLVISIANDNGFSGVSAFNKAFKEEYGVTPSAYRKDNQEPELVADQELGRAVRERLEQALQEQAAQETEHQRILRVHRNTMEARPYKKPWQSAIGIGCAHDLLNPRLQEQLLQMRDELHFTYVKFWGLFHENMMVTPAIPCREFYFNRIDEVLIFLIKHGLKPFLQLGPKPRTLIGRVGGNSPYPVARTSEGFEKIDNTQWERLMNDFMSHLVTRFGGQEVETWIFEMWAPCWWDEGWNEWYNESRFAAVYHAVKKYVPAALVGGCEFTDCCHSARLPQIAEEWRQLGIDPDFISYAAFPYDRQENRGRDTVWCAGKTAMSECLSNIRAAMKASGFENKRLFLTNWNMSISGRNLLNDSVYKGGYLLNDVFSGMGSADMMVYWGASDIYSEYIDTAQILFGGVGLLSVDGIKKPSYYAMEFLSKLRSLLLVREQNYVVTCNHHGIYTIIYHNISDLNSYVFVKPEADLAYDDLPMMYNRGDKLHIEIQLEHVENGVYNVRRQRVTSRSGSVLDEWKRLGGFPIIPSDDRAYLNMISTPKRTFERLRIQNEEMLVTVDAAPNEFGIVEIFFAADNS